MGRRWRRRKPQPKPGRRGLGEGGWWQALARSRSARQWVAALAIFGLLVQLRASPAPAVRARAQNLLEAANRPYDLAAAARAVAAAVTDGRGGWRGRTVRAWRGLAGAWAAPAVNAGEKASESAREAVRPTFIAPVTGVVTSGYGPRIHPVFRTETFHDGIDLDAPEGTPVVAVKDGVVLRVARSQSYGRTVELDHGEALTTFYAHLAEVLVETGMPVRQGDVLGTVGRTGIALRPHLHFEVRLRGRPQDPVAWLPGPEVAGEER